MPNGGIEREEVARGKECVEGGVAKVQRAKTVVAVRSNYEAVCRGGRGNEVREMLFT